MSTRLETAPRTTNAASTYERLGGGAGLEYDVATELGHRKRESTGLNWRLVLMLD